MLKFTNQELKEFRMQVNLQKDSLINIFVKNNKGYLYCEGNSPETNIVYLETYGYSNNINYKVNKDMLMNVIQAIDNTGTVTFRFKEDKLTVSENNIDMLVGIEETDFDSYKLDNNINTDLLGTIDMDIKQLTDDLKDASKFTTKKSEGRRNLEGFMLNGRSDQLELFSLDGYKAYYKEYYTGFNIKNEFSLIVNEIVMKRIMRLKKETTISIYEDHTVAKSDNLVIIGTNILDNTFDIHSVMDNDINYMAIKTRKDIKHLLNFMEKCSRMKVDYVLIEPNSENINIIGYENKSTARNNLLQTSYANKDYLDYNIAFNPEYLKTSLNLIKGYDEVEITGSGEFRPMMATHKTEDYKLITFVLPIRIT